MNYVDDLTKKKREKRGGGRELPPLTNEFSGSVHDLVELCGLITQITGLCVLLTQITGLCALNTQITGLCDCVTVCTD